MRSRELEQRVDELEAEISALRERTLLPPIGIRRRATLTIGKLPLYEISLGSDPGRRQMRGRARAIVAIGDVAYGVLAIGGYARGIVAVGGLATGLVSVGGVSVSLLGAVGGLAIGSVAVGGAAAGGVAVGVSATGYYACGAATAAVHVIDGTSSPPQTAALLRRFGLSSLCSAP